MSYQRKQDRWNNKMGQISKSYKLNRSVVEAFANACLHENTSQSSKLTALLMDYSISIERRKKIMHIRERYSSGKGYDQLLLSQLEKYLSQITDSEIETRFDIYKKDVLARPKFYTLNNTLEYSKDFYCPLDLPDYLQDGASEVIKYISDILVNQIVLFKLMNDGMIMPCQLRNRFSSEININHNHGNSIFEINYNLLPYESFIKI